MTYRKRETTVITSFVALAMIFTTARAADDTVRVRGATAVTGTLAAMSPTEVAIDLAGGQKKVVPVNQIEWIDFAGAPAELKLIHNAISAANFDSALTQLDKLLAANIARAEVKQELQYYKAFCQARVALGGQGDVRAAGTSMRAFVTAYPNNYHHLAASELLGDLFAAIGAFDLAIKQYAQIEAAPWPDYKVRGGVAKGRVLAAQKKYPEALAAFDAALALASDAAAPETAAQKLAAELGKATCLAATGKPDEAIQLVQSVIEKAPPEDADLNGRAYVTLGNCYRQKPGGTKDAILEFLRVDMLYARNRDAHAEALANLARLWNEIGKPERALQATTMLKEQYGNSVWAKGI